MHVIFLGFQRSPVPEMNLARILVVFVGPSRSLKSGILGSEVATMGGASDHAGAERLPGEHECRGSSFPRVAYTNDAAEKLLRPECSFNNARLRFETLTWHCACHR
jgi:hypothetical protein